MGATAPPPPLPHHRAYGSVHGDSIGYANTPRPMMEGQAIGSMHLRAQQTELWTGQGTKVRDRCRRCCWPTAAGPRVRSVPPGDGGEFSTAATERPEAA